MASARRLAFAAAHRMVHRIHRHAAHRRAAPQPAVAPRLADRIVPVPEVADRPGDRAAIHWEAAHLARRQPQLRVVPVRGHQLAIGPRRARDARGAAREQLDVVQVGAERNVPQRKTIAGLDLGRGSRLQHVPDLDAIWSQDVATLPVEVVEERDARRAVRIVFDARHPRRHAVLVTTEVDQAIALLVAAADPAHRHVAIVVAAAGLELALGQRLERLAPAQLRVVGQLRVPERRRHRTEFLQGHGRFLDLLEQLDLLIGLQRHDGLLPVAAPSGEAPLALHLAANLEGLYRLHLDVEDRFHGALDLDLVGVPRDLEEVLVAELSQHRPLLGDERPLHDRTDVLHRTKVSFMRSRPVWVTSTASECSRSYAFTWCARVVRRLRRLRQDFTTASSARSSTSNVRLSARPSFASSSATSRVFGSDIWSASITATAFSPALSESAEARAARRCCFGRSVRWSRGSGPNARPPPGHNGDVLEPERARPVPFWRHGLRPPPDTSPRPLTFAVP